MVDKINKVRYIFNRKDKKKIVIILILIIIGSFLETIGVTIFYPFSQLIINENAMRNNRLLSYLFGVIGAETLVNKIIILSLLIIVFYFLKNIFLIIMQYVIRSFNHQTRINIATRLLTAYMNEPYSFHLNKNPAELIRILQSDTSYLLIFINSSLQLIAEVITCMAISVYLVYTSMTITFIVGTLMVTCVLLYYFISKKMTLKLANQNQKYSTKVLQWTNQSLGGIKEIKLLEREQFFIDKYYTNYTLMENGIKKNEMIGTVPKYITETIAMTGLLVAIIIKAIWGNGDVSTFVPQLAAFAVAAFKLLPSVGRISAYNSSIISSFPSLEAIYNSLKEVNGITQIQENTGSTETKSFKESIKAQNIKFRYESSEKYVLNNISFEIKKGDCVALVGSSGAGKTTLADIILGVLKPNEGTVLVDDWNINDNMSQWHKMIGYIPQTIYLSDDSILKNVAFGVNDDDIDVEAAKDALKKAQILDFVENMPNGIYTEIGDRGLRLSGGQRQRIGIARALYHNPEVLVLDEATSALDNDTEKAVMESIDSLKGKKTMIIIAHRLSTIKNADVVYEVGKGNVVKKK